MFGERASKRNKTVSRKVYVFALHLCCEIANDRQKERYLFKEKVICEENIVKKCADHSYFN